LPLVALGLVLLFRPRPDAAAGLLLVAACPIGGISNAFSYLARASPALSITLTALSCLCAGVTIPLVGRGFELVLGRPLDFHAPAILLLVQALLLLALPVAIGMGIRRHSPEVGVRYGRSLQRLAFAGVAIILLLIIAADPNAFRGGLSTTVPLAMTFVVTATVVGWLMAAIVTSDAGDRFTIAVEYGTRNVTIAIAIAVTLLGRAEFARFAATYFLTELPVMLVAVSLFRSLRPRRRPTLSPVAR
jgi:BASS family bile acid:Na+ symporter